MKNAARPEVTVTCHTMVEISIPGGTLTYFPDEHSAPNDGIELVEAARALLSMYTNRQGDSGKLFLPLARDLSAEEARVAWVRLARALGEKTA